MLRWVCQLKSMEQCRCTPAVLKYVPHMYLWLTVTAKWGCCETQLQKSLPPLNNVGHRVPQQEKITGQKTQRNLLGESWIMSLVLWQPHIPPAARQLTGRNKSRQIGRKTAKKHNPLFKWKKQTNKKMTAINMFLTCFITYWFHDSSVYSAAFMKHFVTLILKKRST